MFERTIEAQALDAHSGRMSPFTIALSIHAAVGLVVAVVSLTIVHLPVGPDLPPPSLVILLPPPEALATPSPAPAKPPAAPKGVNDPGRTTLPPPIDTPPAEPPSQTPSELPPAEPPQGDEGNGEGMRGEPDGSDTGVTDGIGPGGGAGDGDGEGDGGPVLVTGEMQPPVLVRKVAPAYPNTARIARLPGRVVVQAVVGLDGRVESVEVLSSTNPIFDAAALDAVRQWTYRPALMDGRPVRVYFTVVVDFVLR